MKNKRIFIIGHMGAGKGILAQALAKKLNWRFIDADFSLAPSIGKDLKSIIGDSGEKMFHHCLFEILSYQLTQENIVVATDESIVCDDKNRELLSSEFVVHLKVSTSTQLERNAHDRPLLPSHDYKAFLDKLHHERDALFEKVSKLSVNSDDNALDTHVLRVIEAINK